MLAGGTKRRVLDAADAVVATQWGARSAPPDAADQVVV